MGRRTRQRLLVAYVVAGAASCSPRTAQIDGAATAGYTKIDDMEGDGQSIEWTPPSGSRPGWWYASTDCHATSDIWPPPDTVVAGEFIPGAWSYSVLPEAHLTFPGITSTHAARLRTINPLQGVWGASMSFGFAWPFSGDGAVRVVSAPAPDAGAQAADASAALPAACPILLGGQAPVDLSAYSGVTFWAKGDLAGERTVQVMFQDAHTDPKGGFCNYLDSNSPDFCYNGFGSAIALTDTFARYTIAFDSLQQNPNWGYRPTPDVFDVQQVYQVNFQITAPACFTNERCVGGSPPPVTFDIWIDDLYFVNK